MSRRWSYWSKEREKRRWYFQQRKAKRDMISAIRWFAMIFCIVSAAAVILAAFVK